MSIYLIWLNLMIFIQKLYNVKLKTILMTRIKLSSQCYSAAKVDHKFQSEKIMQNVLSLQSGSSNDLFFTFKITFNPLIIYLFCQKEFITIFRLLM